MTEPSRAGYLVERRGEEATVYPVTFGEPEPYVFTLPEPGGIQCPHCGEWFEEDDV